MMYAYITEGGVASGVASSWRMLRVRQLRGGGSVTDLEDKISIGGVSRSVMLPLSSRRDTSRISSSAVRATERRDLALAAPMLVGRLLGQVQAGLS